MWKAVLLLTLLDIFHSGLALQCYSCSSHGGEDCSPEVVTCEEYSDNDRRVSNEDNPLGIYFDDDQTTVSTVEDNDYEREGDEEREEGDEEREEGDEEREEGDEEDEEGDEEDEEGDEEDEEGDEEDEEGAESDEREPDSFHCITLTGVVRNENTSNVARAVLRDCAYRAKTCKEITELAQAEEIENFSCSMCSTDLCNGPANSTTRRGTANSSNGLMPSFVIFGLLMAACKIVTY